MQRDAFLLAGKMGEQHTAVFSNAEGTRNVDAKGETAPLAVARAALLALQEE